MLARMFDEQWAGRNRRDEKVCHASPGTPAPHGHVLPVIIAAFSPGQH